MAYVKKRWVLSPEIGVTKTFKSKNSYGSFEEFSQICKLLVNKERQWRFAKTMAHIPHWYTVRDQWGELENQLFPLRKTLSDELYQQDEITDETTKQAFKKFEKARKELLKQSTETDNVFAGVVKYIRKFGYNTKFQSTRYRCLSINARRYWTQGFPLDVTYIINRTWNTSQFDGLAKTYDITYSSKAALKQDELISDLLLDYYSGGGNVLEIGCATGAFSQLYDNYTGIDDSYQMIKTAKSKYENKCFLTASLESFYPAENFELDYTDPKYDFIFATYGTASYFLPSYISTKLVDHLSPKGKFLLVFMEKPQDLELGDIEPYVDVLKCKGGFYVMCFEKEKYENNR
jgi:SAM-dependent methyltransferase